jgi:hypothetical protein
MSVRDRVTKRTGPTHLCARQAYQPLPLTHIAAGTISSLSLLLSQETTHHLYQTPKTSINTSQKMPYTTVARASVV